MRKNNTWEHPIEDEDGTAYVLKGRHASNLDLFKAIRLAKPTGDDIIMAMGLIRKARKAKGYPTNEATLADEATGWLMLNQYKDISMEVFFENCITSHRVHGRPGAEISIFSFEAEESDAIFIKIIKPWLDEMETNIANNIPIAQTPEQEGEADAESFPDLVQDDTGIDSGQMESVAP